MAEWSRSGQLPAVDEPGRTRPMKVFRFVLAVVAGFVAWFVVATVLNFAIRAAIPGYAEAEPKMTFTLSMLIARLAEGAVASVIAGMVAAFLQGPARYAYETLSVVLLLFFIPVHISLWDKFPYWYHLAFLLSLGALVTFGGVIVTRLRGRAVK